MIFRDVEMGFCFLKETPDSETWLFSIRRKNMSMNFRGSISKLKVGQPVISGGQIRMIQADILILKADLTANNYEELLELSEKGGRVDIEMIPLQGKLDGHGAGAAEPRPDDRQRHDAVSPFFSAPTVTCKSAVCRHTTNVIPADPPSQGRQRTTPGPPGRPAASTGGSER